MYHVISFQKGPTEVKRTKSVPYSVGTQMHDFILEDPAQQENLMSMYSLIYCHQISSANHVLSDDAIYLENQFKFLWLHQHKIN
jgi:hypothetical protein